MPSFPVGCGDQQSPATGDTGETGQDSEELAQSRALGARYFRCITATWACLALKAFKLHLKALKSLLSPCLIALKALKPLLQDSKPMGAKPLALVGLWVLPAGTVGTRLPCLHGRDERADGGISGGDSGNGPPRPRGTVCPHLLGLRAPSRPQALSKQTWCLMAGTWRSLCGTSILAGTVGAGGSQDHPPNPAVLRGEAAGLPWGSSSVPWFPVPHLAGK